MEKLWRVAHWKLFLGVVVMLRLKSDRTKRNISMSLPYLGKLFNNFQAFMDSFCCQTVALRF